MRVRKIAAFTLLLVMSAAPGAAQPSPVPDSLVAEFVEKGHYAGWTPAVIFRNCEQLDEVDQRALTLVLEADLSRERMDDLAFVWMVVLQGCQPPEVVDWFLEQVATDIEMGRDVGLMISLWKGLELASSPRVRDQLRQYVFDEGLPESTRVRAGRTLFLGADRQARRYEFSAALQEGTTPYLLAIQIGALMARDDTEWTLREVGRVVLDDPRVAEQSLFGQVLVSSRAYATEAQRDRLADALEEAAGRSSLSSERRDWLTLTARALRRGA